MSILSDYIKLHEANKIDFEEELKILIRRYNNLLGTYLFLYSTATYKGVQDAFMNMDDYYIIHGMLKDVNETKLDFYIESPGGFGESAEEIAKCLHSKFDPLTFVISGEAKSAGTILVLSGDEIMMTETGSLGPVDAQMRIGRSNVSSFDYLEYLSDVKKEALKNGKLNPADAVIVAQISPGEYRGVEQALHFAQDLIKEWLPKYKFKTWDIHKSTGKPVTPEEKKHRAKEIALYFVDHTKWRSHSRSLKINDLRDVLKLEIIAIDEKPELADIVYRIQTVIKLYFMTSTTYKLYMTADDSIFKKAISNTIAPISMPQQLPSLNHANVNAKCMQCGKDYKFYAKFAENKSIEDEMAKNGILNLLKNLKYKCSCGFELDLNAVRNEIEQKSGKKLVE